MFAIPELPPLIPAKMLSDALAALGAYAEAPSEEDLARAQAAEGMVALTVRLANALYGSALAHVMSTEYTASAAGVPAAYRAAAWQAAGADAEGTAILLHYAAMRLAADLRFISERLPVDLGVMGAAAGAAEALKLLLLEVCTVRSMDDPRAENITTNLACAQDQLATAGERIATLFQAGRDVAATITKAGGQLVSTAAQGPAISVDYSARTTAGRFWVWSRSRCASVTGWSTRAGRGRATPAGGSAWCSAANSAWAWSTASGYARVFSCYRPTAWSRVVARTRGWRGLGGIRGRLRLRGSPGRAGRRT